MLSRLHRTCWSLLVTSALTLGIGVAQVAAAHVGQVPRTVAAPAPALAAPTVPLPPDRDGEVLLHPATTARPAPAARAVVHRPRPAAVPRPRPQHRVARVRPRPAPTFEQDLRRAVARIPFYRPGVARWVVRKGLASYGLTDRVTRTVYVSPRTPRRLLFSVVLHEWAHVISTRGYGGDLRAADAAVMRWYGVSSAARAIEVAADCVARVLGASWTHYTGCRSSHWRYGARYLMVGWRLPEQQPAAS